MSEQPFIPFHMPSIDDSEIEAVTATLRSGWLTTGPRTAEFEREFRNYVQARYALAVNSCTAALHLALAALGLGAGDEVITTPLTFCATVNTILHTGAVPVLADIGEDGNIDPQSIREKISARTRALLPVHYGGAPCRMDDIWDIAMEHDLLVVEDAAHAVGTRFQGGPVGAFDPEMDRHSDAVAFSFYATKNLATGEGGMVTCHDENLLERMRTLCLHGINKDAWNRYAEKGTWYYQVVECGFKYNLSDVQSAIGVAQLRKQERMLQARAAHARTYSRAFEDIAELEIPSDTRLGRHAWHLYPLRLNLEKLSISREQFIEKMHQRGIGTSVHFIPIPLHPAYAGIPQLGSQHVPRAMALYERLISLPLYPDLREEQLQRVVNGVKEIVAGNRRARVFAAR